MSPSRPARRTRIRPNCGNDASTAENFATARFVAGRNAFVAWHPVGRYRRLELKGAVRRKKKIGNAQLFEPVINRGSLEAGLLVSCSICLAAPDVCRYPSFLATDVCNARGFTLIGTRSGAWRVSG